MERPYKRGRSKTRSRSSSRSRSGSRVVSRISRHVGWQSGFRNDSPAKSMPSHEFIRTAIQYLNVGQNAGNLDYCGSLYFQLQNLPSYTEFTTLFDQYRIDHVDVTFTYTANSEPQNITAAPAAPLLNLMTVFDHDDAAIPAGQVAIQQYPSFRCDRMDRVLTRRVYPRVAEAVYNGTFAGVANIRAPWLDSAQVNVQHYGVKFVINTSNLGAGTTVMGNLTIAQKYYLQMRDAF